MNDRAKITSTQLALLAAGSAMMFPYTFMPILRTPPQNQDVWIVLLLSFVYVLLINLPLVILTNKFRGLDFNDINELIMGKIGGKITAIFYAFFAFFCFTACMLISIMFIKTYLMAKTPEWALLLLMLIPIVYTILKGAGTIVRLASIVVPVIIFTVIYFALLGLKDMDINALKPILADSTLWDINKGAFLTAARFSEMIIITVFSYHLIGKASVNKTFVKGMTIFGITFLIMLTSILLVVGSDLAKITNNPYYFYTKQVGGKDLIQRVQSLNVLVWFSGTLIKLSIYGFISSYIFSRIIGKKSQKHYIIPLAIIAFILCMLPFMRRMSTLHILKSDMVFPWIVFSVVFVMSSFLLIIYLFRFKTVNKLLRKKLQEKEQKNPNNDENQPNTQKSENSPNNENATIIM